jgi:hypothetical protein
MTTITTCIAFIVEEGRLPCSYFTATTSAEANTLIQKTFQFYADHGCSVQVLMGRKIEELTGRVVIPVNELLRE